MRICYKFSGEQVVELEEPDARSIVFGSWLRKHIATSLGVSRFRLLVFHPDNTMLADGPIYEVLPDQLDIVIQSKTYRDLLQAEVNHLFDCAWMENVGLVEDLLFSRIDPNVREPETGKTLLQIAASTNNTAMTELLLEAEADPDLLNETNWKYAALHTAARLGHTETLDILLKSNANVNIENEEGLTPLLLAIQFDEDWQYKYIETCRILIEGRADVNSRYDGETPLLIAAENSSYRIMYYLLEAQADVNAVNRDRQTPLHVVTLHCDLEGVKMLLDYSASLEATDARGKTPHMIAWEWNSMKLLKYLDQSKEQRDGQKKAFNFHAVVSRSNRGSLSKKPLHFKGTWLGVLWIRAVFVEIAGVISDRKDGLKQLAPRGERWATGTREIGQSSQYPIWLGRCFAAAFEYMVTGDQETASSMAVEFARKAREALPPVGTLLPEDFVEHTVV
eukprot:s2143_g6.t1